MYLIRYLLKLLVLLIASNAILYIINRTTSTKSTPNYDIESIFTKGIEEIDIDTFCAKVAEEIRDKPILLLGEQQHTDGATLLVKSKIVDLLRRKYNYEIVLMEGSFFYNNLLRDKILNNNSVNANDWDRALYTYWGLSDQTGLLRQTISNQKLDFRGFDYNYLTHSNLTGLSKYIKGYFGVDSLANYAFMYEILEKGLGPLYLFNSPYYRDRQDTCLNQIKRLTNIIKDKDSLDVQDKTMLLTLENLHDFFYANIYVPNYGNDRNMFRDSIMFKNVSYILNNFIEEDKKVIIWAANAHQMYEPLDNGYLPMGYRLKNKFKDKVYSVLFTSGVGKNNRADRVRSINPSSLKSIEHILHKQNKNFIYSTFKDDREIIMKFLGHQNISFHWQKAMDSFIYVDKMTPITFQNNSY
ncbi:Erythromycin esterase [Leadbetterella byssophila DSM 17132]|uniref:Erythromycin esterase n=1 Tax=Leadbetterella byssophila (strain DSM 17132 / JCM 16389 / KACC 11308 / NBRC 106382 / 4M15) TaxID=649349 RepID=E4RQI7_LEAB4|nr:Erythromycin esterase [Leadbetterella byssophila DSM 17132]